MVGASAGNRRVSLRSARLTGSKKAEPFGSAFVGYRYVRPGTIGSIRWTRNASSRVLAKSFHLARTRLAIGPGILAPRPCLLVIPRAENKPVSAVYECSTFDLPTASMEL